MKSEHAQEPVLSWGTPIHFNDDVMIVKNIKSYEGMNGQRVPYIQVVDSQGNLIDIDHTTIESIT